MEWWKNNYFRFGITFLLCLQYSLLRETSYSTIVKPLPILFWLLIALYSKRIPSGTWLIASLICAFIGDILLDLGDEWLKIGTIPFLGSTALLAIGFHFRLRNSHNSASIFRKIILLLLIALPSIILHLYLAPYLGSNAAIGAVLLTIAVLLLWNALANLLFNETERTNIIKPIFGLIGACGIVANYVLYAINISVQPIPRDLVIQVYYWGQAFVTWSFLRD